MYNRKASVTFFLFSFPNPMHVVFCTLLIEGFMGIVNRGLRNKKKNHQKCQLHAKKYIMSPNATLQVICVSSDSKTILPPNLCFGRKQETRKPKNK